MEEHRPRQLEVRARYRLEEREVDTMGPPPQRRKAVLLKDAVHALARHHDAGRRCVETTEPGIAPPLRDVQGAGQDLRKPGVEGGGEGPPVAAAPAPPDCRGTDGQN